MNAFEETVSALIPEWPHMRAEQRRTVAERCAALVRRQIELAPFYIRLGFKTLFCAYRCYVLLRSGFNPAASRRATALITFSAMPIPLLSGLDRLLRSTTLLIYFEQPEVLSALGEETIIERQAAFRAKRAEAIENEFGVRPLGEVPRDEA